MTASQPLAVRAERWIPATPAALYDLVADVEGTGMRSPETVDAAWLKGATCADVGVRFGGRNRIGRLRWATKPTITAADRGARFSFRVPGGCGSVWTYDFLADGDGTLVAEAEAAFRQARALTVNAAEQRHLDSRSEAAGEAATD